MQIKKYWDENELNLLKSYKELTPELLKEISLALNRSIESVDRKRERLGIPMSIKVSKNETEKEAIDTKDRASIYEEVFSAINPTLEKYSSFLKPVTQLTEYSKNKKVETANLVISDMHIGKKNKIYYPPLQKEIETYNDEIRRKMMQRLLDSIAEIVSLHQHSYYFEKLNIFLLGDLIEGDGYVFEGQEFSITKVAGEQLWDAVRDFAFIINELSKLFPQIEVICLVGNHSMATNNRKADMPVENYLEYHIYKALQLMFETAKNNRVKVTVPTSRYYSTNVYGHMFYMTHGDESGGGAKTSRIKRAKDIYINLPEEKYDVYIHGHFHSLEKDPIGDKGVVLSNGAWIPYDDYARKLFGIYTEPKQWFFSTNKIRPVTLSFELDFKGVELTKGFKL